MDELQKNDIIETEITSLGINGEGVCRYDGKTIFVRGALPGERVRAKIILVKPTFNIAILERVISHSPYRVVPPCPIFGKCGGCDLQHLDYSRQLDFKRELVRDTLKKIARIDCDVESVGYDKPYRYRNKFSLPVRRVGGRTQIGFFAKSSHRVVETPDCVIQYAWGKHLIALLNDFMEQNGISAYDEENHRGVVRHLVAREIRGKVFVTLVVTKFIDCSAFYSSLCALFTRPVLYQNLNREKNNVILSDEWRLCGGDESPVSVDGLSFFLHPAGFYQVNDAVREKMYDFVCSLLSGSYAIEAYSGAGLLSARLAKHAKRVYGIEINEQAHLSAVALCKTNGIENFTPVLGDVTQKLPEVLSRCDGETFIVLDPPRTGIPESASATLASSGAKNIVYISCNPATLARDLERICKGGYTVSRVKPYDMFPQTCNVETVVLLTR